MTIIQRNEKTPKYDNYKLYKKHLRIDFHYKCAYCLIHEREYGFQHNFCVDHFKPKLKFPKLKLIYENLYYACLVCNSFKKDKWPSNKEQNKGYRFLDPCFDERNEHIETDLNHVNNHQLSKSTQPRT